ncbi:hypothetical protein CcI49_28740 [Frankia sp. CcI49]|nr:hypothetical protein CcI49_28740 [Frankia sp. CcI49]
MSLCAGCSRLGRCHLGLTRETLAADGAVVTELVCGSEYEGGPEVAHGGWTAAAFDELLGHVLLLRQQLAVTGQLSVTFTKPVPINRPLRGRAWIERSEGRRRYVTAELRLYPSGELLATASAVMVTRDWAHFERHRAWLADVDARTVNAGTKTGDTTTA